MTKCSRVCSMLWAAWLASVGATGAWAAEGDEPPAGFVALFNGRDLSGWKGLVGNPKSRAAMSAEELAAAQKTADERMRAHWKAVDGVIEYDGQGDNLCTAQDYGDFELYCDWKILEGGDSGLYLRGTPQVQIWDPDFAKYKPLGNDKGSGSLWNNKTNPRFPLVRADNPVGEWNTFFLRMVGDRVTVKLNGKLVVDDVVLENYWEKDKPLYPRGSIELQNHGNKLWFRRIWIRELPAKAAAAGSAATADAATGEKWIPLFNGRDLEGWTPKIRGFPAGENFGRTFRVENGVLKVAYDGYDKFDARFGHLFYKESFSHYRLRVEYRFVGEQVPGGPGWATRNSGIMVHGERPEQMAVGQDFPASIEVQLLGGLGKGPRTTANLCTPGTNIVMGGQLVRRHCTNSKSKTYDGDQWVTAEVEVRGSRVIRHIVEGETVLEYQEPQLDDQDAHAKELAAQQGGLLLASGTISLQSESHPVEFRKVELLKLEP